MNIETRIRKLERHNRLLAITLSVAVGCLFLFGATDQREVEVMTLRAQRVELIDPLGKVIGTWGSDEGATFFNFESVNGSSRFRSSCDSSAALSLSFNENRATMAANNQASAIMSSSPSGTSVLRSNKTETGMSSIDHNGATRLIAGISKQHDANFALIGQDKSITWDAATGK